MSHPIWSVYLYIPLCQVIFELSKSIVPGSCFIVIAIDAMLPRKQTNIQPHRSRHVFAYTVHDRRTTSTLSQPVYLIYAFCIYRRSQCLHCFFFISGFALKSNLFYVVCHRKSATLRTVRLSRCFSCVYLVGFDRIFYGVLAILPASIDGI